MPAAGLPTHKCLTGQCLTGPQVPRSRGEPPNKPPPSARPWPSLQRSPWPSRDRLLRKQLAGGPRQAGDRTCHGRGVTDKELMPSVVCSNPTPDLSKIAATVLYSTLRAPFVAGNDTFHPWASCGPTSRSARPGTATRPDPAPACSGAGSPSGSFKRFGPLGAGPGAQPRALAGSGRPGGLHT